jgi:hypothetical protein
MRFSLRSLVLAVGVSLPALTPLAAAPPAVTYLFPAGAQRGTTAEVTAAGTFERWPVGAWVSGKGVVAKAGKEKGKLSVTVAPDAVPGTYWVRLHDRQGASALRPFLVGTLPEVHEREPNDDPKKPQALPSTAVTVNGRLGRPGDVDGYAVKLRKGQTLVASLEANRTLGSPMDAVLQVVSGKGFVLAENHDYHDLDPQVVFTAPADDTYVVRTFAFPATPDAGIRFAGAESYVYRLTVTTGGFAEHAWPLAVGRAAPGAVALAGWNIPEAAKKVAVGPGDDSSTAAVFHPLVAGAVGVRLEPHPTLVEAEPTDAKHPQPISLPVTVTGRIDPPGDVDVYRFEGKKGQKLLVQVESRALGFPLAAVLTLTDAAGKAVARGGDTGRGVTDPELTFTLSRDGAYQIEVRDLHGDGGPRFAYRLRALLAGPDFDLALRADRFVLVPGKPLDIPVSVGRRNGFAGEIEVRAEGLPEGVTAGPGRSLPTGGSAASVTLRLTAAGGAAPGAFRVLGRAKDFEERVARTGPAAPAGRRTRTAPVEFQPSTTHLWLTIGKPK